METKQKYVEEMTDILVSADWSVTITYTEITHLENDSVQIFLRGSGRQGDGLYMSSKKRFSPLDVNLLVLVSI